VEEAEEEVAVEEEDTDTARSVTSATD